ncbi:uncharacterized protein LOC125852029, partial [Solanum stenotomum]|uniref:uncharacterized protein LOC125852029 n=1 Tax=Solanum stenotomum TaxID=172797 RepID=UPI0020D11060
LIVGGGPTSVKLYAVITVDFPQKKVTLVQDGSRLLEFRMDRIDNFGRLKVDENLRIKDHRNIFVVGDITDIKVILEESIIGLIMIG